MGGRLDGRVALVTGASRGIGAAVARRLAAEGAHVIALARTVGGLEELDDAIKSVGSTATLVPCDLGDWERIDQLGPPILERFGRLDMFVGNAGNLGTLSPLGHVEPATWREVFAINVDANWRLIRILDPLLRRAPAGRAVFVSAAAAGLATPYWGPYAAAKAALETIAQTWASEAATSALKVNVLRLPPVATRLRARAFPGEDPASLRRPDDVTDAFVDLLVPDCVRSGEIVAID